MPNRQRRLDKELMATHPETDAAQMRTGPSDLRDASAAAPSVPGTERVGTSS